MNNKAFKYIKYLSYVMLLLGVGVFVYFIITSLMYPEPSTEFPVGTVGAAMGVNVMLIGASGALYAVMLLFSVIYPRARILLFGVLPIRAPVLVLLYFCIELFSQVGSYGGGIAHMTHLSGLVFAYLYCLIRLRMNPWRAWFS